MDGGVVNCLMKTADKKDGMCSRAILYAYFSSDLVNVCVNAYFAVLSMYKSILLCFYVSSCHRAFILFLIVKAVENCRPIRRNLPYNMSSSD